MLTRCLAWTAAARAAPNVADGTRAVLTRGRAGPPLGSRRRQLSVATVAINVGASSIEAEGQMPVAPESRLVLKAPGRCF